MNDDRQLIGEGRVVGLDLGGRHGQHMTVTVLMLQALPGQGGAAGRGPDQEAARPAVAGLPDQVADPLEAEHRVVGVEGDRLHAVVRVGGPGGNEAGHGPGLTEPLLEDGTFLLLVVEQQAALVDRLIELADVAVDTGLAEQRFHAEGAGLVRNDRHDQLAEFGIAQQLGEQMHIGHGGRQRPVAGAFEILPDDLFGLAGHRGAGVAACRQGTAQRGAAFFQVDHLRAVVGRLVEGGLGNLLVADRDIEAGPERLEFILVELLLGVGDILPLPRFAEAVALDGLGEDHRRRALVFDRRL